MEFDALSKSGIANLLSSLGRTIFLPQGIFYWTGRAKKEAEINATIGSACGPESDIVDGGSDASVTYYLPSLQASFGGMTPAETFPYAPILGLPELRQSWRDWILRKLPDARDTLDACMTLPAVTPGITGGLHVVAKLFVDPGEVVVSPDRLWGNYRNIVEKNIGGRIETFPFFADGAFNIQGMKRKLIATLADQSKALLMLNFPNNPVGYNPPKSRVPAIVEALVEVVEETSKSIVVLVDDAYEGYVYDDDALQTSMFGDLCDVHPGILPIKLDGVSKEFLFYGARVGMLTVGLPSQLDVDRPTLAAEIDNKLSGVIRSTVSNCARPVQTAIVKALADPETASAERQKVVEILGRRARLLRDELAKLDVPQLKPLPFNAGFFGFCDIDGISANAVADRLMTEYKTGVVPTESGAVNGIRLAFCSVPEEQIPTLAANVAAAVRDLA